MTVQQKASAWQRISGCLNDRFRLFRQGTMKRASGCSHFFHTCTAIALVIQAINSVGFVFSFFLPQPSDDELTH